MSSGSCDSGSQNRSSSLPSSFPLLYHSERKLVLEGLGISLCKSRVYDAMQEASKRVPGLKRDQVFAGVQTPALGADLTSLTCKGVSLPLSITVDPISGLALTIDALTAEDSQTRNRLVLQL